MNKKTKTYLLLTAVLLIWGIIGYKVLSANSGDTDAEVGFEKVALKPMQVQEKDTFSILADYRDPFLGTYPKKAVQKKKRAPKPKKAPEPEINVQFSGVMTDKDTKRKVYFVTINGQQHLMSVKSEINKVTLLSGTSTSIRIRANGKTRTVELQ